MPELKPIHAVLILAIVAIVALYVLGVGFGATSESPRRTKPSEHAQKLRERFLKPRAVTVEELDVGKGCTLTKGILSLRGGAACEVDVKAAEAKVRSLSLERIPEVAGPVTVEVTPRGKPSVPATFDPLKESKQLDVLEEGAGLKVTCEAPPLVTPGCALRLLPP
ncbi:hypothetical protein HPC49_22445 [Pyxidicoccus fallax]|uniref:Uncharacterized protein n=1 Tax=Pyxidicoccus fallax TaxID=394095 RepID=A0A848LPA4_9BACT|nr:hypothetical protein [Pyxidicoccus fallax]NMO19413.1 hypothetical protein [Pyxidicoccus fallax]NPC80974.1 hypothetical protein [Pyxidicoccus fallax]